MSTQVPHEERARIDDVDELVRRLPEVQALRGRVQDEVARVLIEDVHEYFWVARASENHHPPDERGLCGTWLHVKRVFTAYTMLERTYRAMSMIDTFEANCARAAVLLHDGFKYGPNPAGNQDKIETLGEHEYADGFLDHLPKHTERKHDIWMAEHVRQETDLPEEVAHCIECHGGSNDWRSHAGPEPDDAKTMLVHTADLLASNSEHRLPVHDPSRELRMVSSDLPRIDDEDWLESLDEF